MVYTFAGHLVYRLSGSYATSCRRGTLLRCHRRARYTADHPRFTRVGRMRADGAERPTMPTWRDYPVRGVVAQVEGIHVPGVL
jgi:hypothetical protein